MEKDVFITINTIQRCEGQPPDRINFTAPAKMSRSEDGTYTFEYDESDILGLEGVTTCLSVKEDVADLRRTGPARIHLRFNPNKRFLTNYELPYGAVMMGVSTSSVLNRLESDGILIVCYKMDIQSRPFSKNRLELRVLNGGNEGGLQNV